MRVSCRVSEIELEGEYGENIDSVEAHCPRCGHRTESFGTGDA